MNIIEVFEKLAFPVAISVTLIIFLVYLVKKIFEFLKSRIDSNEAQQQKYIEYLQASNCQLKAMNKRTLVALHNNTEVMKQFTEIVMQIKLNVPK